MCTDICPDQTAIWKWAKRATSCLVSQCPQGKNFQEMQQPRFRLSEGPRAVGSQGSRDQSIWKLRFICWFRCVQARGIYRICRCCQSSFCFPHLPYPAQEPPSTWPPPAPLWTFSCAADSHENVHLHWSHAPVTLEPWVIWSPIWWIAILLMCLGHLHLSPVILLQRRKAGITTPFYRLGNWDLGRINFLRRSHGQLVEDSGLEGSCFPGGVSVEWLESRPALKPRPTNLQGSLRKCPLPTPMGVL